jgi:hypothetical protein
VLAVFGSRSTLPDQLDSFCNRTIAQAILPSSTPLGITLDVWGGPLSGVLGDGFLQGLLSGNDGVGTPKGSIGQGRGGSYTVAIGCPTPVVPGNPYVCTDSFTYEVSNAVWTQPPGFGHYIGNTAKIVGGTGRFQFASGNLNVNGPFIAWPDGNSPFKLSGRWNPELSGQVCGVQ